MNQKKGLRKMIKRLQSNSAKLISRYPCLVLSLIAFVGGALFAITLWLVPLPTFKNPVKDLVPRDTPIANRRLAKEKLTRMLERKYLFTVNDMVNYFGKIQPPLSSLSSDHQKSMAAGGANSRDFHFRNSRPSASNNFALIMSSNDEDLFGSTADDNNNNDDDEDDDDILASILSNVESTLKRRRRRRDSNEVADDNLKISKRELDSSATSQTSSQLDLELDEIINNSPDSRLLISNCDPILSEHCSQIIIESKEPVGHSMLSLESVSLQCQLVEQYLKPYVHSLLSSSNENTASVGGGGKSTIASSIQFESLSSVVARFAGKRSCSDVDEADVHNFTLVMGYCANVYRKLAAFDLMPVPTLEQVEELRVLPICRDRLFVDAYKYLLDREFYFRDGTDFNEINLDALFANKRNDLPDFQDQAVVRFTSIYFSVPKNDSRFLVPFYTTYLEPNFLNKPLENHRYFMIAAVNFDIKIELFNSQIGKVYDYIALVLVVLFVSAFAYSKSPVFALGLVLSIVISLAESYGIQKLLVHDHAFSFLHMSSTLALIVMACVHAFVLADAWTEAKLKFKNARLIDNQLDIVDPTMSIHLKNKVRSVCSAVANRRNFDLVGGTANFNRLDSSRAGGRSSCGLAGVGSSSISSDDQDEYRKNCVEYVIKNGNYPNLVCVVCRLVCLLAMLNSSIVAYKFFAVYAVFTCIFYAVTSTVGLTCCLVIQMKYLNKIKFKKLLSILHLDKIKWMFKAHNLLSNAQYFYQSIFDIWLPGILINFRLVFLVVIFLVSLPGMYLVFIRPSIVGQLTQTAATIQLFASSHPLETYDRRFSEFASSSESVNTGVYPYQQELIPRMRVSFVFGLKHTSSRRAGHIGWSTSDEVANGDEAADDVESFDKENFDFYDQRSQLWFLTFCKAVKRELKSKGKKPTFETSLGGGNEDTSGGDRDSTSDDDSHDFLESEEDWENLSSGNLCLIDLLKIVFTRRCSNDPNDFVNHVCCDQISPFDSNVLQLCLRNFTFLERYIMPYQSILSEKLYFNRTNGIVVAVEIQLSTHHRWTSNYKSMSNIYSELEHFFRKQIEHKYVKLDHLDKSQLKKNLVKNAFFESEFEFFDFQKALLSETVESLVAADLILITIVFIATFNFLITIFSLLTLVLCQSTALGVLMLLGWQIDLLESIGIVISGALCLEASLHLAIQYTNLIGHSQEGDQEMATTIFFIREHTIKNVVSRIGSALGMSTLVCLFISICLMQSSLAILKLYSVYFIMTSILGFVYGVFFFVPLCASFGPLSNYCRIRNNKKSEKSFIEFKRANRAIKNVGNKIAHPIHTTAI